MFKFNNQLFSVMSERVLKQGMAPRKVALSISLGLIIGVFPILGTTIIISFIIAWIFRLNVLLIQAANVACSVFQLVLMVPFVKIGSVILRSKMDVQHISQITMTDFTSLFSGAGFITLSGITGWIIMCIPIGFAIYFLLLKHLEKLKQTAV